MRIARKKIGRKILIYLFFSLQVGFGCPFESRADQNLALLFENGDATALVNPDGSVRGPLYCEGMVLCGFGVHLDKGLIFFDGLHAEKIFDVTICGCDSCPDPTGDPFCQGCINPSCVTSRNSLFVADSIPQIVVPDGVTFSTAMTEHDPILCSDVTGKFSTPGCAGTLELDYRCQNVINTSTFEVIRLLSSSYIISTSQ